MTQITTFPAVTKNVFANRKFMMFVNSNNFPVENHFVTVKTILLKYVVLRFASEGFKNIILINE